MVVQSPHLFFDIDGVLNHKGTYDLCALRPGQTSPIDWLDPICVQRLDSLALPLVLTSSWRHYLGVDGATQVLVKAGLTAPIVGATSILDPPGELKPTTRAYEIGLWLFQHPDVTSWVVIDDVAWEGFPGERFVKTDIQVGLTDADIHRVRDLLAAQGWRG